MKDHKTWGWKTHIVFGLIEIWLTVLLVMGFIDIPTFKAMGSIGIYAWAGVKGTSKVAYQIGNAINKFKRRDKIL